jgi:hypothetical protein
MRQKMKYLLIICIICIGCSEQEDGLWVDDECSKKVEENLIEATDRLWEEAGIDVQVFGRKDLSGINLDPNEITGLKCLPVEEAPKADEPGSVIIGFGGNWGIYLYGGEDRLAVIMHELGHYVGMTHVDDIEAVMYPVMVGNEHYTDADIASIEAR